MANELADQGRLAEAESLYASAVVARTDVGAMTKYTRFLRRTGRQDLALVMAARLLEVGRQTTDPKAQIEALSNIAIIRRQEGNLDASLKLLEEAIEVAEGMGKPGLSELAFLHDNVGLTLRRQGRIREALDQYIAALDIRTGLDDPKGLASTFNNVGVLVRQTGDIADAEKRHSQALELFRKVDYLRGQAITHGYLGDVFEAGGRLDEAEEAYLAALKLDQLLKSPQGTSMNLCQLGRLALRRGDIEGAADYARRALDAGESFGNQEGIAAAYHLFGQIASARDDVATALDELETAVQLYRELEHRVGIAWSLADLALAECRASHIDDARATLADAQTTAEGLNHQALNNHLEFIASELVSAAQEGKEDPPG
jgi:tetratricopeptide (TPR) repeat protein